MWNQKPKVNPKGASSNLQPSHYYNNSYRKPQLLKKPANNNPLNTNNNKNTCYRCHEPWIPGHQCKNKGVNFIVNEEESPDCENTYYEAESEQEEKELLKEVELMKEGEQELEGARISLSALEGDICPETGKLVGQINEQSVTILLPAATWVLLTPILQY